MKIKVKLCGFKEKESLQVAIDAKVDFVGFVFYEKSPRNIDLKNAEFLGKLVPENISKVAVIVDPKISELEKISLSLQPQYFQLHGDVDQKQIEVIKNRFPQTKIIKSFNIEKAQDLVQSLDFADFVDFFLFDAKISGQGNKFDWTFLRNFESKKDWFLAGGLNSDNILQALEITGAKMVDISSGIEKERGIKSKELIKELMMKLCYTNSKS